MGPKEKVLSSVVCVLASAAIVYSVSTQNFSMQQPSKDRNLKPFSGQNNSDRSESDQQVGYKDGTYEGEAEGFGGTLRVSVVIENGKIKSVEVISNSETPEYFEQASAVIADIVAHNGVDVDSISGATITSDAIKEAVYNALVKAEKPADKNSDKKPTKKPNNKKKDPNKKDPAADKEPAVSGSTSVQTSGLKDGTYIGTGMGLNGTIRVRVTVRNHALADIEILSHSEDSPYFENALAVVQSLLSSGDGNVETVSGATYSSGGIIEAVKDALSQAMGGESQNNGGNSDSGNNHKPTPPKPDGSGSNGGSGQVPDNGNPNPGKPTEIPDALDDLYVKGKMSDGEYIGYGVGFHGWGTIKTIVTIKNGEVANVKVAEGAPDYSDDLDFRDRAMRIVDYLHGENARRTVALSNMYRIYKDKLFASDDIYQTALELFGKEYADPLKEADLIVNSVKIKEISKASKNYVGDRYDANDMFDAVSGATFSASGIAESVGDAMRKAVNDATQENDVKDTLVTEPKHKVLYANTKHKLDLSKLKVTIVKKDNSKELLSVKDFESNGIKMFDAAKNTPITDGMSLAGYPANGSIEVIVKHMASTTQDTFRIELGNYSTDYVNQIHYSVDGKTWYRVKDVIMDKDSPENISYLKQVIDAPESFQYKNVKVRVVSLSGEMYEYTSERVAGAAFESMYKVVDAKDNSNVPQRLFIQFTFSGTEADKEKVPDSGVTPPTPEKPEGGDNLTEVIVGGDVISSDLNYSKDIDYIDGHQIKPIKVTLHDPTADPIREIENLPNGLSFDGTHIVGTPELSDSEWDPKYYDGLHKKFVIRIKAKKDDVILVKQENLVIRRDRDHDGIADYNELDKLDIFDARFTDYEPIVVNGVAPTVKDYAAKIKNLPSKGVTVVVLEEPDLSVIGDTKVKIGFQVDGLKKVGEATIKVKVTKPAEKVPEASTEVIVGGDVISSDLNYSKDIDYIDGHKIKPIKVTLHDPTADPIREIENLPNGLSFDGTHIVGTPELSDSDWDPKYYDGLHKKFVIRIKAKKDDVILVKQENLVIRRDRDHDGIADYNELDKLDIFNARFTDYEPIVVNGVAPTVKDYAAKIKNLPSKGVTVVVLEEPDLSVIGDTKVKIGFHVDGLKKVGEATIKVKVTKPVEKVPEASTEVIVGGDVISSDLNYSRDIDYIDGHEIKPIKVTLHDLTADPIREIENLPNGLSFDGTHIVGTPELSDSDWDSSYYNGLHKKFVIRIKAKKGDVILVKQENIVIRRDRDHDGIADYNETEKNQTRFNATLKNHDPIEVRGTAPTLADYSAKIRNLPASGVTVVVLEQPDLSVAGQTSVKLGFQVKGLTDVGEISIKVQVITPVVTQAEAEQTPEATEAVTADENAKDVKAEDPQVTEPVKAEPTEPAVQEDQAPQAEIPSETVASDEQTQPNEKGDVTQR